jgi:tetratricopeptide (TPR) repeat protein
MPQFPIPRNLQFSRWMRIPSWRVLAVVGAVVVVLGGAVLSAWLWISIQQRRGLEAFASAMIKVQSGLAPNSDPAAKTEAVRDLEAALNQQPPASAVAQVTYELANLKYEAQQYPASRSAYELTARGSSPTLARLALVSVGYTWEVQKEYLKAIEAFEKALASLKPGEFLHDDLMMDLARVQELAGRQDDAVKTYRRVVEDRKSRLSDEARGRLAALGVAP